MTMSLKNRIAFSLAAMTTATCALGAWAADLSEGDKTFMKNTAMAGMTEIKLGHVAEKNSTNKEIHNFAAKMIADHTTASNNLKKVAADEKVELPSALDEKHQAVHDKLAKLKGAEFDKDYMKQMEEDHRGVVASIEAEKKEAKGELKKFCDKTLPTVQGHLKMAEDWNKKGK
jgi:putative membrane protein